MSIKRNTGFTLVELFILIVIIAILGVIIAGLFSSKDAGASTTTPIPTFLRNQSAQFVYSNQGSLTIFNAGEATWRTAADVCAELKPFDANLKSVTLLPANITNAETELVWNHAHTELTNINGKSEAVCN